LFDLSLTVLLDVRVYLCTAYSACRTFVLGTVDVCLRYWREVQSCGIAELQGCDQFAAPP